MNSGRRETAGINPRCRNGDCLYQDRCLRIDACHGNASHTPRTDAFEREFKADHRVTWIEQIILEYCRTLERELANVRESVIDECIANLDGYAFMASKPIETGVLRSIDRLSSLKSAAERVREQQAGEPITAAEAARLTVDALRLSAMVDRFLSWPLPESVCSDLVATRRGYPHRSGTTLLTADEARQMLEYVMADMPSASASSEREQLSEKEPILRTENAVAWAVFDVASEELIDVTAIRPDDRPGIEVKPLGWLDNGG